MRTRIRFTRFQRKAAGLVALLLLPLAARADDTFVIFGLTNQAINGAALSLSENAFGLHVDNLSDFGYRGISVNLGEAESGLFFSPQVNGYINDTNFMLGSAFGRISGLDRRICTVAGTRNGWATYPVVVDFTPLGSLSQTLQVYCDGTLVREETNSLGPVVFHTDSYGNIHPRVNPFWRAPDGSVGVLIDFFTSYISLPHSQAFGNRVFIKPERPVSSVDFVSRVEVYGGGGLPNFEAWSEWLGIFNLPHMALGSAVVHARLGELSVTDLGASGDDGVIVELAGASSYEMRLAPLSLPTNSLVQISAKGITEYYVPQGRDFIGPFSLSNSNGSVQVAGLLGAQETNRIRIEVFEDGVFIGSATNEGGICGAIPAGDWTLTACGALPASDTEHSSVYFTFDQAVTFQPTDSGDALTGNELRFSWHEPGLDNGSFKNFQLQAANVPGFTITNGITAPAPLPVLTITQLGDQVRVSWPVLIAYMFLEVSYGMDQPYTYVPGAQIVGSRWQVTLPRDPDNHQFFRLSNWCNDVNLSLNGN